MTRLGGESPVAARVWRSHDHWAPQSGHLTRVPIRSGVTCISVPHRRNTQERIPAAGSGAMPDRTPRTRRRRPAAQTVCGPRIELCRNGRRCTAVRAGICCPTWSSGAVISRAANRALKGDFRHMSTLGAGLVEGGLREVRPAALARHVNGPLTPRAPLPLAAQLAGLRRRTPWAAEVNKVLAGRHAGLCKCGLALSIRVVHGGMGHKEPLSLPNAHEQQASGRAEPARIIHEHVRARRSKTAPAFGRGAVFTPKPGALRFVQAPPAPLHVVTLSPNPNKPG